MCAQKYQKNIKIQLFNLRLTRDIVICGAWRGGACNHRTSNLFAKLKINRDCPFRAACRMLAIESEPEKKFY